MKHFLKNRARNGFSLVEISVVILIMSILFSVIFGFYFGISRIAKKESPLSIQQYKILTVLNNMRTSLNQAYFHGKLKRLVFVGKNAEFGGKERDRLTFAAVHPGAERSGVPAVREVSFYVKADPNSQDDLGTLIRREDQLVDKNPGEGGLHYPLLKNVVSLSFSYSVNGRKFHESWHHRDRNRLPRLIKIILVVKVGAREERFETIAYAGLYHK